MKVHKYIPLLLGLLSIILFSTTWAQTLSSEQSLEVSPPSQEIQVDPGKTITLKTKIRNRSKETHEMKVRIEDFTVSGEEGQVSLTDESPWSVTSWTTVTPNTFTLAPGESQEVEARVAVPNNGQAGGRYGSFVFTVENPNAETNAATVSQEVASLFLVRISGPVSEELSLVKFETPAFSEFGPVPLTLKFQNNGNVHIKTYGLIHVSDMFGNKTADVVVPGTNVFPTASRNINAQLDKRFLFGPYTATAIMYYGNEKPQTLNANASFFVFPTRFIIAIVIVLFILFSMRKRLGKALKALAG